MLLYWTAKHAPLVRAARTRPCHARHWPGGPSVMPILPRWIRVSLVAVVVVIAIAAGFAAYRWSTAPVTLTVAAGSLDGDAVRLISAIANKLPSTGSPIRLKVVDTGTAIEAARAFSTGKVDVAIVRSDVGDLSAARTVVLLSHGVVLIIAPPGSTIEDIAGLKGKVIGVVGLDVNHNVVNAVDKDYDLTRSKTQFKNLWPPEIEPALRQKQIQALLVVMPITEKYLSLLRNALPRSGKKTIKLIAIDSAGAIAAINNAYESYELPKGSIRGSPAVPDDDLTTLRVPFYLVANAKVPEDRITALAKAVMETRRDFVNEYPLLAQIAAPSTDKDAQIPVHPGAATYFGGDEKTFFDKYGDMLFYGSMLLGTLASIFAGLWKFMVENKAVETPLTPLYDLFANVHAASDERELSQIETQIDAILKQELEKHARGSETKLDPAVLSLAAHRLEYWINQRRLQLRGEAANPAPTERADAPSPSAPSAMLRPAQKAG
jgi:TRAP transporter TAXI family solute receptor